MAVVPFCKTGVVNAESKRKHATLLFIHGGGVGPWMWAEQVAFFARNVTVLTPTLPGLHPQRQSTFFTHAQAAGAVAEETGLLERPHPVTVIGRSLGGQTAIQLAASYPAHVERLVVVSSLLSPWHGATALSLLAAGSAPLSVPSPFLLRSGVSRGRCFSWPGTGINPDSYAAWNVTNRNSGSNPGGNKEQDGRRTKPGAAETRVSFVETNRPARCRQRP